MRESIKQAQEVCKKTIICLETGKIYGSFTDAASEHDCNIENIRACITGRGNTARGYHFILFTGYIKKNKEEVLEVLKQWELEKKILGTKRRKIGQQMTAKKGEWKGTRLWCRETGCVFESVKDASRRTGIEDWRIQRYVSGDRICVLPLTFLKLD